MATFGRISNSLVSSINENTLALASLNFDFSLIKVEAPVEFFGVGNALAKFRRDDAEFGATHRTARKLGALFESIVPEVPNVIAAYGKRSTEIMETPGLNPVGSTEKHGAFAQFVGADATSIWAAATSGGISIAIHLLACLLARAFKDPAQSTSVWAELVLERQRELVKTAQGSMQGFAQIAASNAASQPIPREELRQWDSYVRAWLQTADRAMLRNYTQLKLILKNIRLPIGTGANLYADVMRSWTRAMLGLERLMNSEPQSITDGAILLAISAWHLYPNLLVLGNQTTNVTFSDPLIPSGAILTVGITQAPEVAANRDGVYWSVALSHYRYYGKPAKAVGEIDDRLTIDELHLVALGSLLGAWRSPRSETDISLQWFVSLNNCVNRVKTSLRGLKWLDNIARAARRYLETTECEKREQLALIDFGRRRGRSFLSRPRSHDTCLPWFGLRSRYILKVLVEESPHDCGVEFLRQIAGAAGLSYDEALITVVSNDAYNGTKRQTHKYSTAVPRPRADMSDEELSEEDLDEEGYVDPKAKATKRSKAARHAPMKLPTRKFHQTWTGSFILTSHGELKATYHDPELTELNLKRSMRSMEYGSLPKALQVNHVSGKIKSSSFSDCVAYMSQSLDWFPKSPVDFTKVLGDSSGAFRLWVTGDGAKRIAGLDQSLQQLREEQITELIPLHEVIETFDADDVDGLLLWQYFEGPEPYEPHSLIKPLLELLHFERQQLEVIINSLRTLALANEIYGQLDGATISSSIVEKGIHSVKWGAIGRQTMLNKSMVFSCIAMLETGNVSLPAEKLDHVMALSSGSSLFVLTRLLADPNTELPDCAVTRIVGNIGRPGISLLIPPAVDPLSRPLSNSYRAVRYETFDGNREDNFTGTSLHLSFTSHELPLDYGAAGIIDHQVFLVESVVSVYNAGQWVADLNPLKLFEVSSLQRLRIPRRRSDGLCKHPEDTYKTILERFTTIDTWEEVLDTPPSPTIGLIRAHKNWPARLATSLLLPRPRRNEDTDDSDAEAGAATDTEIQRPGQEKPRLLVLDNGDDICWVCVYRVFCKQVLQTSSGVRYLVI
ncbi:hypothetical protein S40285_06408 [Stachybotrys chlorohalonatus IBT 40285]|uniref:Uncharacterized protein n=1 Tax=Stachybotrys chlorohalonatus (strain IBT 40285) TaxID=1283841 RepID=A0A084QEM5_STAC4|nr:hypothetical protein S40285_06408 [Stachybotrys chlorohalonata IBT 40285]